MANSNSDLSDIRPDGGVNANVSPTQLPIRGEKRIISAPVAPFDANVQFELAYLASGQTPPNQKGYANPTARQQLVEQSDYNVTAALAPYQDYVIVRLYNRGLGGNGMPDGSPAVYRFLINPSQVVVNRQTIDGQTMTRAGWQIGVWGEDSLQINVVGKTAGQYFSFGLTDRYQPYSESYRNLEQLQVVFENNGYWFEGEQAAEGPLAADFARRVIKMHADVELIVGNFIWQGMFDSLTISQSADAPFLMDFNLSFVAWKERFRKNSPYGDTFHNDVLRAHDYGAWKSTAIAVQQAQQTLGAAQSVALTPDQAIPQQTPPSTLIPPAPATPTAPAVTQATAMNTYPQVDATANDYSPTDNIINRSTPSNTAYWNGDIVNA
jgi:hypothetical protein